MSSLHLDLRSFKMLHFFLSSLLTEFFIVIVVSVNDGIFAASLDLWLERTLMKTTITNKTALPWLLMPKRINSTVRCSNVISGEYTQNCGYYNPFVVLCNTKLSKRAFSWTSFFVIWYWLRRKKVKFLVTFTSEKATQRSWIDVSNARAAVLVSISMIER